MKQYLSTNLQEFVNESKQIQLKRQYKKSPSIIVESVAPVRNKVVEFISNRKRVSKNVLRNFILENFEYKNKNAANSAISAWIKRNSKYFITENKNGVTFFRLSKIGNKLNEQLIIEGCNCTNPKTRNQRPIRNINETTKHPKQSIRTRKMNESLLDDESEVEPQHMHNYAGTDSEDYVFVYADNVSGDILRIRGEAEPDALSNMTKEMGMSEDEFLQKYTLVGNYDYKPSMEVDIEDSYGRTDEGIEDESMEDDTIDEGFDDFDDLGYDPAADKDFDEIDDEDNERRFLAGVTGNTSKYSHKPYIPDDVADTFGEDEDFEYDEEDGYGEDDNFDFVDTTKGYPRKGINDNEDSDFYDRYGTEESLEDEVEPQHMHNYAGTDSEDYVFVYADNNTGKLLKIRGEAEPDAAFNASKTLGINPREFSVRFTLVGNYDYKPSMEVDIEDSYGRTDEGMEDDVDETIDESCLPKLTEQRKAKLTRLINEMKSANKSNKLNEEELFNDKDDDDDLDSLFNSVGDEDSDSDDNDEDTGEVEDTGDDMTSDEDLDDSDDRVEITEFILSVDDPEAAIAELAEIGVDAELVEDTESDMEDTDTEDTDMDVEDDTEDDTEDVDVDSDEESTDTEDTDTFESKKSKKGSKLNEGEIRVSADNWPALSKWLEEKGVDIESVFDGDIEVDDESSDEIEDEDTEPIDDTEDDDTVDFEDDEDSDDEDSDKDKSKEMDI